MSSSLAYLNSSFFIITVAECHWHPVTVTILVAQCHHVTGTMPVALTWIKTDHWVALSYWHQISGTLSLTACQWHHVSGIECWNSCECFALPFKLAGIFRIRFKMAFFNWGSRKERVHNRIPLQIPSQLCSGKNFLLLILLLISAVLTSIAYVIIC